MSDSSSAQAAAIIYANEVSPTMGEVSDVVDDDDTTVVDDDTNNNNSSDDGDGGSDDAVFSCAARDIMNRVGRKVGSAALEDRRFREHFGAPFEIVRMVWDMMEEVHLLPEKCEPKHLLWTLYFLKCYPKEGPGCAAVGGSKGAIDPKTMRKWVWLLLERIGELADEVVSLGFPSCPSGIVISPPPFCHRCCPLAKPQINFESRLVDDALNDCLMSIDGTDFRVQQKGVHEKGNAWGSHKYAGKSAVRYELGIDILKGNLVWVEGPYPAGAWPDIKIFLNCLVGHLLPGERVEADNGYVGHPDKIMCPNNPGNPKRNLGMQSAARSRHETFNGRLKNWGILERTYRHDVKLHGIVFTACAVITQLCVANGEPLFEVEYGDGMNDDDDDEDDDDEEEDE